MKKITIVITAALIALIAASAHARSVYLNGVDISAIRNRTFENAQVTIDKDGNLYIVAQRYDAKETLGAVRPDASPGADRGGPNPALSKRYYLVTQPSAKRQGPYRFEVRVNGETRKVIKAGSAQVIVEISAWLKKGSNDILIITTREPTTVGAASSEETDLIVGIGHEENKIVKIDMTKARISASASQKATVRKPIALVAE